MLSDAERAWIDYIHGVDNDIYSRCVARPGANVATYSFTPDAETVVDTEAMSYHEWPEYGDVDFLCIRYGLAESHFPFHYLRFWTQNLQEGGSLLVFAPKRLENWVAPDGLECLSVYLAELGMQRVQEMPLDDDYWATASVWHRASPRSLLLRWSETVSIHAGAMAIGEGEAARGLLIAGNHGVGKTSLAIGLLRSYWGCLGVPPSEASHAWRETGGAPRFVADAWADIGADAFANGLLADDRPLRIRPEDHGRWALPERTSDPGHKERWRLCDVTAAPESELRARRCEPRVVLWPTVHVGAAYPGADSVSPERPFAPLAPSSPSARQARLRRHALFPYLGHNLPTMRRRKQAVLDRLAGLPQFDVYVPGFQLEHALEIIKAAW
jgi:hypothetical protein